VSTRRPSIAKIQAITGNILTMRRWMFYKILRRIHGMGRRFAGAQNVELLVHAIWVEGTVVGDGRACIYGP